MDLGERKPGTISSGISAYGYDMRLGYKFGVFSPIYAQVIDPKNFDKRCLVEVDLSPSDLDYDPITNTWAEKFLLIPPHSFVLAESLERFKVPRDTLGVVLGKSTYARCGLIVNCTPMEPEWEGVLTIELSNTTPLPLKVYPGEGIAQVLFIRSDEKRDRFTGLMVDYFASRDFGFATKLAESTGKGDCERSYKDKKGRYQAQTGITPPSADTTPPVSPQ